MLSCSTTGIRATSWSWRSAARVWRVLPTSGSAGPSDMNGTVSGRLLLSGTGRSVQSLNGAGELHVVDANIYELPVLVSMLKVLTNRTPNTTAFNRCDMQFAIQGEHVHFEQLNLLGDAVSLYGKGETNFDRRLESGVLYFARAGRSADPALENDRRPGEPAGLAAEGRRHWDDPDVQRKALAGGERR